MTQTKQANGQTSKKVALKVRRQETLRMHMAGMTHQAIADQLGVDRTLITKDIKLQLSEMAKLDQPAADNFRNLQTLRYNRLMLAKWPQALQNDEKALEYVLRIMDRLNAIWGIIPQRPQFQVNMDNRQQNLNVGTIPENMETVMSEPNRLAEVAGILKDVQFFDLEQESEGDVIEGSYSEIN